MRFTLDAPESCVMQAAELITCKRFGVVLTVTCEADGRKIEILFTLIEVKYMNFKSAGTDDMNYYIWERETGGE